MKYNTPHPVRGIESSLIKPLDLAASLRGKKKKKKNTEDCVEQNHMYAVKSRL